MYELYKKVDDAWWYCGTYDLTDDSSVKAFAEECNQFGQNGIMVKVIKEEESLPDVGPFCK